MSDWGDFAVVTGAATAALLGLLSVAVSIRVETITNSPELRNRSAQSSEPSTWPSRCSPVAS